MSFLPVLLLCTRRGPWPGDWWIGLESFARPPTWTLLDSFRDHRGAHVHQQPFFLVSAGITARSDTNVPDPGSPRRPIGHCILLGRPYISKNYLSESSGKS